MSPSSCRRTNASMTAAEYGASMVKIARSQSREQPSFLSCAKMRSPVLCRHCQTRSRNASRPMSCRLFFSLARSSRSTTICVAMPAWSDPGNHIAL